MGFGPGWSRPSWAGWWTGWGEGKEGLCLGFWLLVTCYWAGALIGLAGQPAGLAAQERRKRAGSYAWLGSMMEKGRGGHWVLSHLGARRWVARAGSRALAERWSMGGLERAGLCVHGGRPCGGSRIMAPAGAHDGEKGKAAASP
jgi:hypothetical protein